MQYAIIMYILPAYLQHCPHLRKPYKSNKATIYSTNFGIYNLYHLTTIILIFKSRHFPT